jgi:hypothetical protein
MGYFRPLLLAAACFPGTGSGESIWNGARLFKNLGYTELSCDGRYRPAPCCVCKAIIRTLEADLDDTDDDYNVQVGFRMGGKKKRVPYRRSEQRITEVLDVLCDHIQLDVPKKEGRLGDMREALKNACTSLTEEFGAEITSSLYDNLESTKDKFCAEEVQVCPTAKLGRKEDGKLVWDGQQLFEDIGYQKLQCGSPMRNQASACCVCEAVMRTMQSAVEQQTTPEDTAAVENIAKDICVNVTISAPKNANIPLLGATLGLACGSMVGSFSRNISAALQAGEPSRICSQRGLQVCAGEDYGDRQRRSQKLVVASGAGIAGKVGMDGEGIQGWDGQHLFEAIGYRTLVCGKPATPKRSSCCVCEAVATAILAAADASVETSGEGKSAKSSGKGGWEGGLEALSITKVEQLVRDVCAKVTITVPKAERDVQRLGQTLAKACKSMVHGHDVRIAEDLRSHYGKGGSNRDGGAVTLLLCSAVCSAPDDAAYSVEAMFGVMDMKGTGLVSKPKFRKAVVRAGSSTEEADALFVYADTNEDGKLELQEFVQLMAEDESAPASGAHQEL